MTLFEASRRRTEAQVFSVPRYRGSTVLYMPCPEGGSYVVNVECRHAHKDMAAADECAHKLASFIERYSQCPSWADDDGGVKRLVDEQAKS